MCNGKSTFHDRPLVHSAFAIKASALKDKLGLMLARGNRTNGYDILSVEKGPFAVPAKCRNKVGAAGETSMSWISFVGLMNDGKEFWFSTPFNFDFFEMPEANDRCDTSQESKWTIS